MSTQATMKFKMNVENENEWLSENIILTKIKQFITNKGTLVKKDKKQFLEICFEI